MSDIIRKKLERIPAPVLQQSANELRDIAENLDKMAMVQMEKAERLRQSQSYRRNIENAHRALWDGLQKGLDFPAALTQAAFAYNVEPKHLEILWPPFQKKILRKRDEDRMRRVMVMWRNGRPISEIANLESVTERTINRIVERARKLERDL